MFTVCGSARMVSKTSGAVGAAGESLRIPWLSTNVRPVVTLVRTSNSTALSGRWPRVAAALTAFALLTASSHGPAFAADAPPREPTARAEWLSARAEEAFSEGRFSDAIKLYLDAWEAVPSAAILYNVAFIYDRRLQDPDLAIQYYDRAAASADADAGLVEKARARVAAIRAERGNKLPPREPDPEPEPDSGPLPLGPILLMGGGGALFLGGVGLGFVASSTEDEFQSATTVADKRSLQSSGQTQALVADLLMVGGLLTAAGGFLWYLLDSPDSKTGEQRVDVTNEGRGLRVEPMFVPGGAGVSIGGSL